MKSTSLIVPPGLRGEFIPKRRELFRRVGAAGLAAPLLLLPQAAEAVTTDNIAYGTYTAMTVTNLQSLAADSTDPYAGWQSARVDNTSTLADDYEVQILLSTANTSASGDKAIYVFVVPWIKDGSNAWTPAANFSTTTRPTGSEGTASISFPNSMKGPITYPYITTQAPVDGHFTVAQLCGGIVPDGWSLALVNNCGAALSTGCVVAYRPITYTNT